jgi:hypothetical protein
MIKITENLRQEMERAARTLGAEQGVVAKLGEGYDTFCVCVGEKPNAGVFLQSFTIDGVRYTLYQKG